MITSLATILIIVIACIGILFFAKLMFHEAKQSERVVVKVIYFIVGLCIIIGVFEFGMYFIPIELHKII